MTEKPANSEKEGGLVDLGSDGCFHCQGKGKCPVAKKQRFCDICGGGDLGDEVTCKICRGSGRKVVDEPNTVAFQDARTAPI